MDACSLIPNPDASLQPGVKTWSLPFLCQSTVAPVLSSVTKEAFCFCLLPKQSVSLAWQCHAYIAQCVMPITVLVVWFQVTRADVDVQPYAFTTKSLFVGHMDYKYLRWQVRALLFRRRTAVPVVVSGCFFRSWSVSLSVQSVRGETEAVGSDPRGCQQHPMKRTLSLGLHSFDGVQGSSQLPGRFLYGVDSAAIGAVKVLLSLFLTLLLEVAFTIYLKA